MVYNRLLRILFTQKRRVRFALLVLLLIIISLGVIKILGSGTQDNSSTQSAQISQAIKGKAINREFTFYLVKGDGVAPDKPFKFLIEGAQLRDEIVVKGKKATAVKGRDFLIVTIKITNTHNQSFKINTRDFVRLSVDNNQLEWLAPDIHNDPVEVQAISTKLTRVGFPVNESAKTFALQIGEINGIKEIIQLDL